MKFYGVRVGRQPGVYLSWETCRVQVQGFPGAQFKSFPTKKEAEAFVRNTSAREGSPKSRRTSKGKGGRSTSVDIWVDGSCLQHAPGGMRFGWAFVIVQGARELHRASGDDIPVEAHLHRNVAGEIVAVLKALSWCQSQGIAAATIFYDYEGLARWVDGSWKTKTPFTQNYAETVRASNVALKWEKVLAHSGEYYNEVVDALARQAAQSSHGNSHS